MKRVLSCLVDITKQSNQNQHYMLAQVSQSIRSDVSHSWRKGILGNKCLQTSSAIKTEKSVSNRFIVCSANYIFTLRFTLPYLTFSHNWIRTFSECHCFSVLIQKIFRISSELVLHEVNLIQTKIRVWFRVWVGKKSSEI